MSKNEEESKTEYERNKYRNIKEKTSQIFFFFLYSKRLSEKTLKFDNVEVNKKELHASKQPIALDLENLNQILKSDQFKHKDTGIKYFIGYKGCNIIRPLFIIFLK